VKSRKGGKAKNTGLSFAQLMKMSSLNKHDDDSSEGKRLFNSDDEIKELDEEDDEEHKIVA